MFLFLDKGSFETLSVLLLSAPATAFISLSSVPIFENITF